ncbi:hypothetical protein VTK26DRAFT_4228 [Humicola hyalothermophila]
MSSLSARCSAPFGPSRIIPTRHHLIADSFLAKALNRKLNLIHTQHAMFVGTESRSRLPRISPVRLARSPVWAPSRNTYRTETFLSRTLSAVSSCSSHGSLSRRDPGCTDPYNQRPKMNLPLPFPPVSQRVGDTIVIWLLALATKLERHLQSWILRGTVPGRQDAVKHSRSQLARS